MITPPVGVVTKSSYARESPPAPLARRPTGRPARTHVARIGTPAGESQGTTPSTHPDAGPRRVSCTVAGEPIRAICIQARPTVWATGQGRLGDHRGSPIRRCQDHDGINKTPVRRVTIGQTSQEGNPPHTPEILRVPGHGVGGTGGPAPTTSSELEG